MIQLLLFFGSVLSASSAAVCDGDWVPLGQKCLLLVTNGKLGFEDATAACTALGATLASIESEDENEAIGQMIQPKTGSKWGHMKGLTYIGLQLPYTNFDDGTPVTFTNWGPREPNGQGEKCAVYGEWRNWQDVRCRQKFHYLCQKKVASVTLANAASPTPVAPPTPGAPPAPVNPCANKADVHKKKSDCEYWANLDYCTSTQYKTWLGDNCALSCCEKAQETQQLEAQVGEVNRLTRVNNALRIALEALEN